MSNKAIKYPLEGPSKIKISDQQLDDLLAHYKKLQNEMNTMLDEFYRPLELLIEENVFTGKAAEQFSSFATLLKNYLEISYSESFEDISQILTTFKTELEEVDQ